MPKYIATAETIETGSETIRRQSERRAARARTVATPRTESGPVVYATDVPPEALTAEQCRALTGKRGGRVLAYHTEHRISRGLRRWYTNRLRLVRAV